MDQFAQYQVPVSQLKRVCDCATELSFCRTSMDAPQLDEVIGQDRAVRSMQFGLAMDAPGYNIYVVGPPGTGKSTYVQAVVNQVAARGPVAFDWCYIHNFSAKDSPLAVSLPAGQGIVFQKDMQELVADLKAAIPKAFESSDYDSRKDTIVQAVQQEMQERFRILEQESAAAGLSMKQTPRGFVFIPLREGKPITGEDFEQLPLEERQTIEVRGRQLQKKLDEIVREGQLLEKQATSQIDELEVQITQTAAEPPLVRLKEKYHDQARIVSYLDDVLKDIAINHDAFKGAPAVPTQPATTIYYAAAG